MKPLSWCRTHERPFRRADFAAEDVVNVLDITIRSGSSTVLATFLCGQNGSARRFLLAQVPPPANATHIPHHRPKVRETGIGTHEINPWTGDALPGQMRLEEVGVVGEDAGAMQAFLGRGDVES